MMEVEKVVLTYKALLQDTDQRKQAFASVVVAANTEDEAEIIGRAIWSWKKREDG